ncbi:acyl-ACP thioesterase [Lactobacillus sp. S2-2]|uniref:acyl-[acyl-carrier-protein] thioesterase n=1 Tax=Lactobacillus sp. S2-2 TaxID=2692917 RepID=UPI001EFFAE14|nr:acyl-ACP thioesterase domain-containing protein [Lactobacillus sp. S2-2]MCF6515666.1 acyl-ACP thioesterase [Lactobacillus sp. S2-2]
MNNQISSYEEKHHVNYYECNSNEEVNLSMVLELINLASQNHGETLNQTNKAVQKIGVTWVVVQYYMEIKRLPKIKEDIILKTESTSYNKYFADRKFWIKDENRNDLVVIDSLWVTMDMETRKMVKIPPEVVLPFRGEEVKRIPKLPKIKRKDENINELKKSYHIRFSDIDWNGHVNNANYIEWMVDVLPFTTLKEYVPTKVNIKFEDEVKYGNDILSSAQIVQENDIYLKTHHEITINGHNHSVADLEWGKR